MSRSESDPTAEADATAEVDGAADADPTADADSVMVDALLRAVPTRGTEELPDLNEELARRADAEGVLDLTYRVVDSPLGGLLVVASPKGVVRVAFEAEGHDAVLAELAVRVSPRLLRTGLRTDAVAEQLEQYFAGRRRDFQVDLDLRLIGGFRRSVVERLAEIPYGSTATYSAVAAAAGNPGAVRAVGSACSHNPVPVVVPCHRVVRSDGTIGGYLGGADAKRTLLALESAA